ncbi:MAG: hypothetical protein JNK05_17030 [Myxococcales bacterium]|nr:hypothetical protein [Myxococcales bacterium]
MLTSKGLRLRCARAVVCAALGFTATACGTAVSPTTGADRVAMDAVVDTGQREDVRPRADALAPYSCETPRDCESLPEPGLTRFGRAWSCINQRCTWEPRGGQNCRRTASGCIECDGQPPSCNDRCLTTIDPMSARMESSTCARDFFRSVASCVGSFVTLSDGPVCVLTDAGTGAPRYILSCGTCEVVFIAAP